MGDHFLDCGFDYFLVFICGIFGDGLTRGDILVPNSNCTFVSLFYYDVLISVQLLQSTTFSRLLCLPVRGLIMRRLLSFRVLSMT